MISPSPAHIATSASTLKDAFPPYLGFLFSLNFPSVSSLQFSVLAFLLLTFLITVYIIYRYFQFKRQLLQKSTLLEIKPPAISLQSAFSTNQLFTIFYSLDHDTPFIERLFNVKITFSYEIVSTKEEGIRYIFSVPEEDVPIIKKNLLAYLPGVIIKEIPDYLQESVDELQDKQFSIYEFKLGKSYVLPLQQQDILNQHDPIAYITGQMTKQEASEMISIQFVTTPVTGRFHFNIMEHISRLNKRMYEGKEIVSKIQNGNGGVITKIIFFIFDLTVSILGAFSDWLMDIAMPRKNPYYHQSFSTQQMDTIRELSPKQKYVQEMVEKKINQNLFETTIRLFIMGSNKDNITSRRKGLIPAFSTFNNPGYQTLKAKNCLSMSHPLITKYNYVKLKHRLLSSTSPILSVSELSSIYHFPYTTTTHTEDIQSVKSTQLPAPLSLKNANGSLDTVFATNIHGEVITPIGLTLEERRRHMYVIGATGMGKSTLMLQMIKHDLEKGRGLALVDPHGDLAKQVIGMIPKERISDVVYFNPTDRKFPIGINILELPEGLSEDDVDQEKDFIVSTIISIFHKLFTDQFVKHRMEHILRNTILTALDLGSPTLLTIDKLLTDSKFRKAAKEKIKDSLILDYWKHKFENVSLTEQAKMTDPITNKLGRFLTSKTTRRIIAQKKSTIQFDDIMNSNKILICNLSKGEIGEDISSFLGNLIIAKIQLAAMRRSRVSHEMRQDFFLYVDEFQNFATAAFAQILSEARKYRLGAVLAHQNISQIKDDGLSDTIIGNSGTVLVFRTQSPEDEAIMQPYLAPLVQRGQISNLPKFNFYIKINAEEPQDPFTGRVEHMTYKIDPQTEEAVINESQKKYGTPAHLLNEEENKEDTKKKPQQDAYKKEDKKRSTM